jgi:manganese/zinc/iron transport system permease protein
MHTIEETIVRLLLTVVSDDTLRAFLRDPRQIAILIGVLIAVAAALPGTFLLLRGMALTSDAISHTVLLGIVITFLLLTALTGAPPDLGSPWLLLGAAAAGVATVILTETLYRSGLVQQDAALGLAFPLLFAIAVILISRQVDNVHLDADSVVMGEIGLAWANTRSHCLADCAAVTITPDDPRAQKVAQCTNCMALEISPRDAGATFQEICLNCGRHDPAEAWQAGLVAREPLLFFWPQSLTVTGLIALGVLLFTLLLWKELKISTFDPQLAAAAGFRPIRLHYALMAVVSLVAVGAFDAVGSILVIAFFIIPPATAFLLTDRLGVMVGLAALLGSLAAWSGYALARGTFFTLLGLDQLTATLNARHGLTLPESWNSAISASMVLMMFALFLPAWLASPRHGVIPTLWRRARQQRSFADQVVLTHVRNHTGQPDAREELAMETLHTHFRWSPEEMQQVLARLQARRLVTVANGQIGLTERGASRVREFRQWENGDG